MVKRTNDNFLLFLCGGKSSRFQKNKLLLTLKGQQLWLYSFLQCLGYTSASILEIFDILCIHERQKQNSSNATQCKASDPCILNNLRSLQPKALSETSLAAKVTSLRPFFWAGVCVVIEEKFKSILENKLLNLIDLGLTLPPICFAPSGLSRSASVYSGLLELPKHFQLATLSPSENFGHNKRGAIHNHQTFVYIHDGARPFVHPEDLLALEEACLSENYNMACLVSPCRDSLYFFDKGGEGRALDRSSCKLALTPQAFHMSSLLRAYQKLLRFNTESSLLKDAKILSKNFANLPVKPSREDHVPYFGCDSVENLPSNELGDKGEMLPCSSELFLEKLHTFSDDISLCMEMLAKANCAFLEAKSINFKLTYPQDEWLLSAYLNFVSGKL